MHSVSWKNNPFVFSIVLATVIAASLAARLDTECKAQALDKGTEPKRSSHIKYIQSKVPKVRLPNYAGRKYEAKVPDTLDFADRSAMAVNGLTGPTDPKADYELYWWAHFDNNPPWIMHTFDDHVQMKFYEALPLVRLASGNQRNRHVEQRLMEVLLQMQGPDGLLYYPLEGRPWAENVGIDQGFGSMSKNKQYAEPWANGKVLPTISLYYQLTGDPRWKQLGEGIVDGLARKAVARADYAFYPKGIYAVSETPDGNEPLPDGWTGAMAGPMCAGLSKFYSETKYDPAKMLAGKLARFVRYHATLFDSDGRFVGKNAWGGPPHFHLHTTNLLGLLEYAVVTEDRELMQFVRRGFEFAKTKMDSSLLGYTPEYIDNPKPSDFSPKFGEILGGVQTSESCGVADMVALGIKLTTAGVGDYWDDVDRWSRNHLAESQLTHVDWVDGMIKNKPATTTAHYLLRDPSPINRADTSTDNVLQRCVGGFGGWILPNDWQGDNGGYSIMACCTGNGTRALYYVWKNILAYDDGHLKVNLLLNRASRWADVDSRIPYEGRVDITIKQKCNLSVRIPEWVSPEQANFKIAEGDCRPSWAGRFASVGKVVPGDIVTVTFPIFEKKSSIRIQGKEYTVLSKGNTVVGIEPPGKRCPLYQREKYRANKAQWKTVERFVPECELDW